MRPVSRGRAVRTLGAGLGLLVIATGGALALWARLAPAPPLGVVDGRLRPCPPTPNCVATRDASASQLMPTLPLRGDPPTTIAALAAVVSAQPRTTIVERRADYLRAEFRSRVFGYVDDVEFLALPGAGVVQFRSASRVGRGDLGVNRARMEALRAEYLRE